VATKTKKTKGATTGTRVALTGNDAVAEAWRQINPDVVAAYPITPQTELMHKFASFVSDGLVDTKFVLVESEHSAMSCVIGASAGGCRCATATCANGLALMWEMIYIAASLRLPTKIMPETSRRADWAAQSAGSSKPPPKAISDARTWRRRVLISPGPRRAAWPSSLRPRISYAIIIPVPKGWASHSEREDRAPTGS